MLKSTMWVEKHRPKKSDEVIGNNRAKLLFRGWLQRWKAGSKAALLFGPPGIGKTTLVQVTAREFGYRLIEMNASDSRTKEKVMRIAGRAAAESSLHSFLSGARGSLILLDEVDGIFPGKGADLGGIEAIMKVIGSSRVPVVLVANNPWNPRLRYLRNWCEMIRFYKIRTPTLANHLRKICEKEGVKVEDEVLQIIASKADGDVRSAVNDLQAVIEGRDLVKARDIHYPSGRDREHGIFETLRNLFSSTTPSRAESVLRRSEEDYSTILHSIHDNLPLQFRDSEKLAKAYEALSKADLILGRASKTRNWSLLTHVMRRIAVGIASVSDGRCADVKYTFPPVKRVMLSATKVERERRAVLCDRIKAKCHVSRKVANQDFLPFIRTMLKRDPSKASALAKWLSLEEKFISHLV